MVRFDDLGMLDSLGKAIVEEAPEFKASRCVYPMPDWTGGICNCHHRTDEHEKLVSKIEQKNGKPFDTTPNQHKFMEKHNPWRGITLLHSVANEQ